MLPFMSVTERFLKYVQYDTQSDPASGTCPSSPGQLVFAHALAEEMKELGLEEVGIDEYGYLGGYLPSNAERETQAVGFIAHLDTSPDMCGRNVKPKIVREYTGNNIILDKQEDIVLTVESSPELSNYVGQDLIVTDGHTLLGADDKAGIAEILTAIEYLKKHPEIKHGKICICFTPDEEIGRGADHFDIRAFGARFAYTLDGGEIGGLEFENFNAAQAKLIFKGRNAHPGYAKNKMVNSIAIANDFLNSLPKKEIPELTSGYDGFFHVTSLKGSVEETEMEILIRDFGRERFEWRKSTVENGVRDFSKKYGLNIELEMTDQYYNMRERIEPARFVVDIARQAMEEVKVKPRISPIRGGTDGANLSYRGLPTPNLFTGGHNFHSRYEYIPVSSMEKAVEVLVKIMELCAKI